MWLDAGEKQVRRLNSCARATDPPITSKKIGNDADLSILTNVKIETKHIYKVIR